MSYNSLVPRPLPVFNVPRMQNLGTRLDNNIMSVCGLSSWTNCKCGATHKLVQCSGSCYTWLHSVHNPASSNVLRQLIVQCNKPGMHGHWLRKQHVQDLAVYDLVVWHMCMHINLLHVTLLISCSRNSLICLLALSQDLWWQETKDRFYCLRDDFTIVFLWSQLFSYLPITIGKCPMYVTCFCTLRPVSWLSCLWLVQWLTYTEIAWL